MFVRVDSDGTMNQLQGLKAVPLIPTRGSQRGAWMLELERIESIEIDQVVRHDGKNFFVIDVYLRRERSRAASYRSFLPQPSADSFAVTSSPSRKPDLRIEKRYSEFMDLRGAVYKHAFNSHYRHRCAFCERVVQFVALGGCQPTLGVKIISSKAALTRRLTTFLRETLALVLSSASPPYAVDLCNGQSNIPHLLCEFLLRPQEPQTPIRDVALTCI